MTETILVAYKNTSEGSKLIADALGIKRLKHEESTWTPSLKKTVINWGAGDPPEVIYRAGRIINHPENVMKVINKRVFFEEIAKDLVHAPRVPEFTFSQDVALRWLEDGYTVLARTRLEGARGQGIIVMELPEDLVSAPLYTKLIPKEAEYRIHIVNGKMVFKQQKIRSDTLEIKDPYIRSYDNGYILVTKVRPIPEDAITQAVKAVNFFGLDFGGVDVVTIGETAYVLEINSAPWMNEPCAKAYAAELMEMLTG